MANRKERGESRAETSKAVEKLISLLKDDQQVAQEQEAWTSRKEVWAKAISKQPKAVKEVFEQMENISQAAVKTRLENPREFDLLRKEGINPAIMSSVGAFNIEPTANNLLYLVLWNKCGRPKSVSAFDQVEVENRAGELAHELRKAIPSLKNPNKQLTVSAVASAILQGKVSLAPKKTQRMS